MATITDLTTEIQTDVLRRTDMTATIERQVRDAHRAICGAVPFEELQRGAVTIPCVVGQQTYNLSTILSGAGHPELAGIISLRIEYTSSHVIRLKRDHVRTFDAMAIPQNAKPVKYARFTKSIELWPPPDAAYNLKLRYWHHPTENVTLGATVIAAPQAWEELIKWEAVYRLYTILNRPMDALGLITPTQLPSYPGPKRRDMTEIGIIPRLWNDLLKTISERENVDEDFSINPVVRRYTHA